jgi:hypothetical protein
MLLTTVVVLLVGLGTIPFWPNRDEEMHNMDKGYTIPPIDAAAPTVTETATFALG